MGMVKDFYNIPEYGLLLPPAQTALSSYVVEGKGTAKEALDSVAAEHTKILTDAGYLKEGAVAAAPAAYAIDKTKLEGIDELVIWWAQWDPANYLQEIGNMFEAETGVKVTVVQEPWGSYQNKVLAEWAARGTGFDMVVGDSQWIGQGVTEGHYVDMTDFLVSNGLKDSVTEATLKYYGEYPPDSGKYYAYPTEGDAEGWAYRSDLLNDPKEKADFKAKFGYDYSVPPKDFKEFVDLSKFFFRPTATPPVYGAAVYTQKDYDAITMGFQNAFFTYGCDWHDANWVVEGVMNKKECIESLEAYKALYDSGPPGNTNSFYPQMNDYFINGQATFAMNYFAFLPALANQGTDPNYYDKVGFFSNPKGPYGQQFAALGGQGTSINSYIDDARKQASFEFIKWFAQDDIQMKWAELGGYTCNKKALASEAFLKAAPYNAAFAETMGMVKDFYNIPEYGLLLPPAQTALSSYVVEGKGTAKEALDAVAAEHTKILTDAGYIK
jgi:multiple sugar transport system substrate-binding protein